MKKAIVGSVIILMAIHFAFTGCDSDGLEDVPARLQGLWSNGGTGEDEKTLTISTRTIVMESERRTFDCCYFKGLLYYKSQNGKDYMPIEIVNDNEIRFSNEKYTKQ